MVGQGLGLQSSTCRTGVSNLEQARRIKGLVTLSHNPPSNPSEPLNWTLSSSQASFSLRCPASGDSDWKAVNMFVRRFFGLAVAVTTLAGVTGILFVSPAAADSDTFSSTMIGQSGSTPTFNETSAWSLSWSYSNCSGGSGNFSVEVNGSSAADPGPNELGPGGSGSDVYYDAGTFNLSVISECDWSITVAPYFAAPSVSPTFSNSQTGQTGQTPQFSANSGWTMSWSYSNCSGGSGNFNVNIVQPAGDFTFDAGPNELGPGGTGTDTYTDSGVFSLQVISECDWTISINSAISPPSPPPAPAPAPSPTPAAPAAVGIASIPNGSGYWIAFSNGAVAPHGNAGNFGGVSNLVLNAPINHIVATPDGGGYWLVASDGGTFSEGDAQFYGSTGGIHLNAPVVDIAPTPDGRGYWLVAADGGIFSYGDAAFHGSTGSIQLNQPVVGMAADSGTGGYWLVARDGGIFAFDAPFDGSTGGIHLNKPVNGMAATSDGNGYWFVASDGGIFNYGDARFYGSTGSLVLNAPIVGMAPDNGTGGYWLLGSDGGIFSYNAPFYGAGA